MSIEKLIWPPEHALAEFTASKSLADYLGDQQLRWSVERGFEIMGEALNQLFKLEPAVAAQVSDHRKIISFRHVLIHGYSRISDERDIVRNDLPVLRQELDALLAGP